MPHQATLSAALLADTVDLIVAGIEGLHRDQALDVVMRSAKANSALRQLRDYLLEHQDGLHDPRSDAPLALGRVARLLAQSGYDVGEPACRDCGRVIDLPYKVSGGRLCRACYRRGLTDTCCHCGRIRLVEARTPDGPLCGSCRQEATRETCSNCGKLSRVAARDEAGQALCQNCRPNRRYGTCAHCGRDRHIPCRSEDGWICRTCYAGTQQPRRPCGRCGHVRAIRVAARDGNPDICEGCYRGPVATCCVCGRERPCHGVGNGKPTCSSCRPTAMRPCADCGRVRRIQTTWPMGPVCSSCYSKILGMPVNCPLCGECRPLVAPSSGGGRICGPCAGFKLRWACQECGTTADPYEHDKCARCTMTARVRDLLTPEDGEISPPLWQLAEAFEAVDNPRSIIAWLSRSSGARLLAAMARGEVEVTHKALDAFPQDRSAAHLRHILVHAGILPERTEYLEQIGPWLDQILADQPAEGAKIIRAYAQWDVLRRARRRAASRTFTYSAGKRARTMIRIALELVVWLRERGQPLQGLRQGDLEEWATARPGTRAYLVNGFLKWAHARRLADKILLPVPQRAEPSHFLEDDQRWDELDRCLSDESMSLPARVAGALLFLYGLQPTRLVSLKPDDVQQEEGDTYLMVANGRLPLPPALARLTTDLRDHGRIASAIGRVAKERSWLFHGVAAGRPLSESGLRRHLENAGIHTRAAHNTALIELAADLPALVVAETLGIHIETAVRWSKYARRDWADYLVARADDLRASTGVDEEGSGALDEDGTHPSSGRKPGEGES
jgi:hypothetical protein